MMNFPVKCGCVLHINSLSQEATVDYCPLHAAAPTLEKALAELLRVKGHSDEEYAARIQARAALALAQKEGTK